MAPSNSRLICHGSMISTRDAGEPDPAIGTQVPKSLSRHPYLRGLDGPGLMAGNRISCDNCDRIPKRGFAIVYGISKIFPTMRVGLFRGVVSKISSRGIRGFLVSFEVQEFVVF